MSEERIEGVGGLNMVIADIKGWIDARLPAVQPESATATKTVSQVSP